MRAFGYLRMVQRNLYIVQAYVGKPAPKISIKAEREAQMRGACYTCGASSTEDGVTLRKCSGCKQVLYCSSGCQQSDWRDHKKLCGTRLVRFYIALVTPTPEAPAQFIGCPAPDPGFSRSPALWRQISYLSKEDSYTRDYHFDIAPNHTRSIRILDTISASLRSRPHFTDRAPRPNRRGPREPHAGADPRPARAPFLFANRNTAVENVVFKNSAWCCLVLFVAYMLITRRSRARNDQRHFFPPKNPNSFSCPSSCILWLARRRAIQSKSRSFHRQAPGLLSRHKDAMLLCGTTFPGRRSGTVNLPGTAKLARTTQASGTPPPRSCELGAMFPASSSRAPPRSICIPVQGLHTGPILTADLKSPI
ncbi:hypothetical protein DFH07DRAFT_424981 [Mycena maculata]|uniref:MYND-type domain-containing protein n=1 Tax=Mycena maculata TaxID=230809 RepID=A0AAD7JFA2_9AGAR|nr:hypothetical protein DFH07DRAFT_424981 [Mycena maculata]